MFSVKSMSAANKADLYGQVREQLSALLEGERDPIANAANMASLLFHTLPDLNWAGFYFLKSNQLVLGPFQGKPACIRIPLGSGVCGTAAQSRTAVVVPDVNRFAGHIACDTASRSEIVVPLIENDLLIGVLDMDSPNLGRFDDEDRAGCEALVEAFLERTDFA